MADRGFQAEASERFAQLLDSVKAQYDRDVQDLREEVVRLVRSRDALDDLRLLGQGDILPPSTVLSLTATPRTVPRTVQKEFTLKTSKPVGGQSRNALDLGSQWASRPEHEFIHNRLSVECEGSMGNMRVSGLSWADPMTLMEGVENTWRRKILNPNATWRTYWAFVGLGMVFFDMVHVPLQAFDLPTNTFFEVMDWCTLLFWTCDIVNSFLCGYWDNGELVLSLRRIAHNYLKGWFCIDLLVVGPDWVQKFILAGESDGSSVSRLLRGARAVRILRLLRISKLQRILIKLYDMIDNEYSFILAELVKMMFVILFLNHFIACGWFLVGSFSRRELGMASWIAWNEQFVDATIGYQYTTSLHWTLTQFTPASMDVVARNILERLYSIGVLLFAMVAFSSIVGSVTHSMTTIRQMKEGKLVQFWKLRRYLKQRNVSSDLTHRMLRFVEYQCSKQEKTIQTQSVMLLTRISEQLGSELAYELHSPCLSGHPFHMLVSKEMKGIAFRICHMAIKSSQIATGDILFSAGEEADSAYVLKSGNLSYILRRSICLSPPMRVKEWLAEAVLWAPWRYRGICRAASPSEILALNSQRFGEAMSHHPKSFEFARRYGERFVRYLNIGSPSDWSDVLRDEEFINLAIKDGMECEEMLIDLEEAEQDRQDCQSDGGEGVADSDVGERDEAGAWDEDDPRQQRSGQRWAAGGRANGLAAEDVNVDAISADAGAPQVAAGDASGAEDCAAEADAAAASDGTWHGTRTSRRRTVPVAAPKSWASVSRSMMPACFTPCGPCSP